MPARNDPVAAARALMERGDLEGAERTLAVAVLEGRPDIERAVQALVVVSERRGDVGMQAQQALEQWLARGKHGPDGAAMRERVYRLFDSAGVTSGAVLSAALPDLPELDGFAPKPVEGTIEQQRPRSLSDLRSELEFSDPNADVFTMTGDRAGAVDEVADTTRNPVVTMVQAPIPAVTPPNARTPGTAHELAGFDIGSVVKERYLIRAHLGRGGHATVFGVHDRELDEECALKVFHHSGDAVDVARFKREVSLSRKVVHPNVVTLYDIGQEAGFYYLTMELLEGEDLSSVLRRRPITMAEGCDWLIQTCRGLQAAHDKGIVHRDVKPGNLFVQRAGPLKVMDFGIAKPADSVSLTSTGQFVGTPQFVSPEQVKGEDVGVAADIYSLGVVAYLLVTGTLPFRDKDMVALIMKHATVTPDAPRTRNPDVPAALDALIVKCLAKDPLHRPASCAAVAAALEALAR